MTTIAPRPRAASSIATRAAARRLRGPSNPESLALRIAPVTITGFSEAASRSSAYAVSSIVSVPCVTTAPATASSRSASATAAARSAIVCGPMFQLWSRPNSVARTSAMSRSPGVIATSSSALTAGTAPPVAGSIRLPIVPPVVMI